MLKLLSVLAIVLFSFATSFRLNANDDKDPLVFEEQSSKNTSVTLNQFDVFSQLGTGMFSDVYLVRKNTSPDSGQLYALKVINVTRALELEKIYETDSLKNEREMLEAAREWPFATGLHYAWRERVHLFLAMDFAPGGNLLSKLIQSNDKPDANTAKIILAEAVSIVEQLHANGVLHLDCHSKNFLIQSDGHLIISDFGIAKVLLNNNDTRGDWLYLEDLGLEVLEHPLNKNEISVLTMFRNMTDADLPELKNHPYFNGIDWDRVAARESKPPFQPTEIDLTTKLQNNLDIELDEIILERLRGLFERAMNSMNEFIPP